MALDPKRTVAELKHLRTLTGDENGAQRVAWTDTWLKSREWLRTKLDELPLETHMDEAGNVWSTLQGESDKALIIGGHLDFGSQRRLARRLFGTCWWGSRSCGT